MDLVRFSFSLVLRSLFIVFTSSSSTQMEETRYRSFSKSAATLAPDLRVSCRFRRHREFSDEAQGVELKIIRRFAHPILSHL